MSELEDIMFEWYDDSPELYEIITEKSHGKLKFDFRLVVDLMTGHKVKIVYDLKSMDPVQWNLGNASYDKARKRIRTEGNTDHKSNNQKVLAIVDLNTKKQLNEVYCTGIFNAKYNYNSNVTAELIGEEARIKKMAQNPKSGVFHIVKGQIDTAPSWKSTFSQKKGKVANKNDEELSLVNQALGREYLSKQNQPGLVNKPWKRGTKAQNLLITKNGDGTFSYDCQSKYKSTNRDDKENEYISTIGDCHKNIQGLKQRLNRCRYHEEADEIKDGIKRWNDKLAKANKDLAEYRKNKKPEKPTKESVDLLLSIYESAYAGEISDQTRDLLLSIIEYSEN